MHLIARLNLAINEQSEKFWYGIDDKRERERERVYFFASTRVTEKKNDYTSYGSNSTVTHNTLICAQRQEAPKNR